MSYTYLLLSKEEAHKIALVTFNRPEALNAFNFKLMTELLDALETLDKDPSVHAIVLTGNEKAFAAGADIKEFAARGTAQMLLENPLEKWQRIEKLSKPLIAAVSGFALGGGCEIMLMCDMVIASETAKIGLPEINIGVIPGAGGTQRLTRIVGKFKAMELILTGRMIDAKEALELGLVTKVVPATEYLEEAKKLAREIAAKSPVAVRTAKEAIRAALSGLEEGLAFERKSFYLLFDTEDKKEGMQAFLEKRKPEWKGR
ncbi:MAG: enoyl-CoA hydratase-related protein [Chloroherpetonaceae bacterium]|nr:enoyl-CoA hydratase-related protein [Chloroherpetonaceae bacterium]MCS7211475.1 enoyl-CoA hydratase-related protein [Chloroherpetonaceae bacterium]MDW8019941.1 enoyl-CoA hydratase-related protein [Chloroherpetonaceae bacterium]